jgi:sterol desaturase/sphingolipid hydroxylase (fatty acid hydroxylase superfamily)
LAGMVSLAGVNVIFLCTAMFTFMNPALQTPLIWYEQLLENVPTLIDLHGAVAVLAACLIGDFCFYWSHRWCHKVRLFWNLGHINHHRAQEMSQLTHSVDPHALLLDTAGGKAFVLVLLPLFSKLFTMDLREGGWVLVALMVVDVWLNPSHSVALCYAEIRCRPLRWFRYLLVTPGVHYTHHSREEAHNLSDGANFGARFTLWDRLFGTYAEPPQYIPETGLYGAQVDYCRNPLRFVFLPYVQLVRELRDCAPRYWLGVLFAHASWQPPKKPAEPPRQLQAAPAGSLHVIAHS